MMPPVDFDDLARMVAPLSRRRALGLALGGLAAGVLGLRRPARAAAQTVCSGPTTVGPSPCGAGTTPCGPCCCQAGIACRNPSTGQCGCPAGTTQCGTRCCQAGVACANTATSTCRGAYAVCNPGESLTNGQCAPTGSVCANSGDSCAGGGNVPCPHSTGCVCVKTTAGAHACVANVQCGSSGCSTDSDCGSGQVCVNNPGRICCEGTGNPTTYCMPVCPTGI
jgi:hypothetical protein